MLSIKDDSGITLMCCFESIDSVVLHDWNEKLITVDVKENTIFWDIAYVLEVSIKMKQGDMKQGDMKRLQFFEKKLVLNDKYIKMEAAYNAKYDEYMFPYHGCCYAKKRLIAEPIYPKEIDEAKKELRIRQRTVLRKRKKLIIEQVQNTKIIIT